MGLIILIGIIVVVFLSIVGIYNSLIGKKNEVKNSFAGIDVQLKKRYDLIPNLVESVKQYMNHERELLSKITELRSQAMSGNLSTSQKVDLNNQMSQALGSLKVAVENYPDLKSNQNFLNLDRTLNEVEAQISASRRAYNSAVTTYNNALEMFPSNIVAAMISLKQEKLFEAAEVERQNVDLKKQFNN